LPRSVTIFGQHHDHHLTQCTPSSGQEDESLDYFRNDPSDLSQDFFDDDDNLFADFVTWNDEVPDINRSDLGFRGPDDGYLRDRGTHADDTVPVEPPLDWQQFIANPPNPLVFVSDSDPAHQLGCNRSPSDGFTESGSGPVFPSASSASDRPNTLSLPHYSSIPVSQPLDDCLQHSFNFLCDASTSYSGTDNGYATAALSYLDSGNDGAFFSVYLALSPMQSSASTSTSFPESPHILSQSLPHSSTSSPCPPLWDLSSACSPTPDLRTPNSSLPFMLYTNLDPDALRTARAVSSATPRPLRASLVEAPLLSCPFTDYSFSCSRQLELTEHQNTMHEFPYKLGCLRSFTTSRSQQRHHQSEQHRGSGSAAPSYRCGGCGRRTPATRRDNYRRHLEKCKKRIGASYICHCGQSPTFDREEHLSHVADCKGKAGRPRGSM